MPWTATMDEVNAIRILTQVLQQMSAEDSPEALEQVNRDVENLIVRINALPPAADIKQALLPLRQAFEALLARCRSHSRQLDAALKMHCAYHEGTDAYASVSAHKEG